MTKPPPSREAAADAVFDRLADSLPGGRPPPEVLEFMRTMFMAGADFALISVAEFTGEGNEVDIAIDPHAAWALRQELTAYRERLSARSHKASGHG